MIRNILFIISGAILTILCFGIAQANRNGGGTGGEVFVPVILTGLWWVERKLAERRKG